MTRIRLGVSEAVWFAQLIDREKALQAGFVGSASTIILAHGTPGSSGYLADIAVMHQLGSGVRFSRAFSLIVFG